MVKNRKPCQDFILDYMGRLTKGGGNRTIYERLLLPMNDNQFDQFITKVEQGMALCIWASSTIDKEKLEFDNIKLLAKEIGLPLKQRLIIYDEDTGIKSMTSYESIVGTAEWRKQRQMLVKKFGAAKHDHDIDDLTGQVMGDSRSTGISQPEITVLRNLGLYTLANELYNVKGGDLAALAAYKNDLLTTGRTTTNGSLKKGDIAKVLDYAYHLMRGRHIDSNLNKRYG